MQVLIAFFKQPVCNTNALLVDIIRPLPAGARFDFVKGILFIAWPVFIFQLSRSALSCLLLSRVRNFICELRALAGHFSRRALRKHR